MPKQELQIITEGDPEFDREEWLEETPAVEHKAEATVIEATKHNRSGTLGYTLLIKDRLNLDKPVVIQVDVTPNEFGKLRGSIYDLEDAESIFGFKIE